MNFKGAKFDPGSVPAPGKGGYVYHDERIILAVNVALATDRPLLITGAPGAGKSTLARDVARHLRWAYLAMTITSRTQAEDLGARSDTVARLSDAQNGELKQPRDYLVPGVLWWAFDPGKAAELPAASDKREDPGFSDAGVVVLLDEIDKAEPDLPNDLLGPLNSYEITVPGPQLISKQGHGGVLIMITSNGERTMPPAFLRRCVVLELDDTDPDFFISVATSHFGSSEDTLYADVATRTIELGSQAVADRRRRPSMAEYLDTVKACLTYGEHPPSDTQEATPLWAAIEEAALRKSRHGVAGAEL